METEMNSNANEGKRWTGRVAWVLLACGAAACGAEPGNTFTTGEAISQDLAAATDAATPAAGPDRRALRPNTRFYVRPPDTGATKQFTELLRSRRFADARRLVELEETPQAVWFSSGSPDEVEAAVRKTMRRAEIENRVPVLVAYDLPYRDCGQYSAGGALDTAAYEAWIDGFARGIGRDRAVVILEPDGLGIIPYNTTIFSAADWCKPTVTDTHGNVVPAPGATPADRYAQLNYAVDSLETKSPRARVYLDGSHSAWLGVGEAAYRLHTAGVERAQGFFLNVSNYQSTSDNTLFGTWVSDCIAAVDNPASWGAGHFEWCASQYDPTQNYALNFSPAYAATVTAKLQSMLAGATATAGFVIDTGRNGQGPWTPTTPYSDPQTWCNAPGRGVGPRPTAATAVPLLDAYLWIKVPGESDGACTRGVTASTTDPEWGGIADPAAGDWFPEQAAQLAALAAPAF